MRLVVSETVIKTVNIALNDIVNVAANDTMNENIYEWG